LEGLEAVEIQFSDLAEVIDFRIESEYFEKRFLLLDKRITSVETISFTKIATFINGRPYSSDSFNLDSGVKVSKIGDVTRKRSYDSWEYVEKEEFQKQKGQLLKDSDILMTLTGDPPDVGKVNFIYKPSGCTWNQRVAKIKILDKKKIKSNESLYAILSTEYSRSQLERFAKGIRQRNLGNESLERLRIPIFSLEFQEYLEKLIKNRFSILESAKESFIQAEQLLLQELNLADFRPSQETVNVKTFSESFGSSGRLDAEYYQVKYDELEKKIKSGSFVSIKDIRTDNFRGLQPQYVEDGDLDIINSKHILEQTLDYDNFEKTSSAYWDEQERARVFKNDILTYTTGANIGRTQVYLIDKKALASNHVNILRLKEGYNSQYIGFVMNSLIGRLQTEKLSAGSAQAELYPKDIDNFLIPIIDQDKQQQVAELVEESFTLKKQSEHLLDVAKHAVEMAIEQDEQTAMQWIKEQTNE